MIWCNRDLGSPKMPRDMCHSTAPFPVSSNEILAQFHLTFLVARVFPIRGGKELNQEYKSIQKYMQWACGCASILVPSHTISYQFGWPLLSCVWSRCGPALFLGTIDGAGGEDVAMKQEGCSTEAAFGFYRTPHWLKNIVVRLHRVCYIFRISFNIL